MNKIRALARLNFQQRDTEGRTGSRHFLCAQRPQVIVSRCNIVVVTGFNVPLWNKISESTGVSDSRIFFMTLLEPRLVQVM